MTTVIRIDPDDELPAILERLPTAGACVLVLPPHARALNSAVGAKLLGRRAEALGSRVAVVSGDHAVLAHARAAGLPVAETVDEAQRLLGGTGSLHTEPTTAMPVPAPPASTSSGSPRGGDDDEHEDSDAVFTAGTGRVRHDAAAAADADAPGPIGGAAAGVRGASGGARTSRAQGTGRGPAPGAPPPGGGAKRPRVAQPGPDRGPLSFLLPAALVVVPLLLLAWLAWYVLGGLLNPSATLILRPRATIVTGSSVVRAVFKLPPAKRGPYRVAMARVTQSERTTGHVPVTGHIMVPDHVASGRVELANTNPKTLLVPAGTIFTTALNKVSFVTTRDVTLPPAHITFSGATYPTAYVPISATAGGHAGNVPAGAIKNAPAAFTGGLNVRNTEPTRGGTDRPERVVDPHVLSVTATNLFGALEQKARQDIARHIGVPLEEHILSESRSPVVSHLAADRKTATVALSITVEVAYVHRDDLVPAATASLQPRLAAQPSVTLIPKSVDWTATWTPEKPVSATASWTPATAITQTIALAVTGHAQPPFDWNSLLHAISGKSRSEALVYLNGRPDVAHADIKINPPWADHLPSDVTNIHVNLQQPQ